MHALLWLSLAVQPAFADSALEQLRASLAEPVADAAPASAPVKARSVRIRFPSWEIAAGRSVEAFAGPGVPLPSSDVEFAREIFGDSIDYDAVRIVQSHDEMIAFAMVWGDTIRVGTKGLTRAQLMHELVHIWQYQTRGLEYISDSLWQQACAFVKDGDRDGAYSYKADPSKSFFEYTAEQQGNIVQNFVTYPAYRKREHYKRWIAQIKTRKFLRGRKVLFEEKAAGLPPRGRELPPVQGFEPPREGRGVPQLEFRF